MLYEVITLFERKVFTQAMYQDRNDFVFEGGGIESNGKGILLTTSASYNFV